ncbi:MAG: crotonase/enoyl-CoA hydratase family protein [Myxococcales bacterium]|nr:crotonase/enoyl-CoA hydratase family protein [Myxococcales bacterium]
MTDQVRFELDGDVAVITMDDGKANALTFSMIADVDAAFDRAAKEAKAIVLTGREGKLCAGFDLKTLMGGGEPARDLFVAGGELFLKIYEHPLPVVVAATGHAIAGGVLLLAVGDVRIGADGPFKIGLNEVAIGVPLPVFAHEIAKARLDPRRLDRATMRATVFTPEEAAEVGWLERVVSAAELRDAAMAEAKALAALPAKPYAITKQSMRRELVAKIRAATEADLAEIARRMSS